MEFIEKIVAPEGRNKYGNYAAAGNTYKSVVKTTYAGNNTTTTLAEPDVVVTPVEDTTVYAQALQTSLTFNGRNLTGTSTETKTTVFQAYNGITAQNIFVGDLENATGDTQTGIVTLPNNYGIQYQGLTILPVGMTANIISNGTSAATLAITADSSLTIDEGILRVPVVVYVGKGSKPEGNDLTAWYGAFSESQEIWLEISWTVKRDRSDIDLYTINLTNDSAMINCDSNGDVLPGAIRPTCTIQLFYGDTLTSATYYEITYNSVQAVSGLSVNHSTGVITFGSDFNFLGTSLEITCKCVPNASVGMLDQVKIMTVTKAFPGADGAPGESGASGADAVTRWITLSADAVSFDSAGTPNPSIIYATCWKQVGENPVEEDTATTIYYGYGTSSPTAVYTTGVTINPQLANYYLTFGLKNSNNQFYELETVAFVRDGLPGTSGQTGEQGRQGAAIRGPRKWSDLLQYVCEEDTMRMCNGHYDAQHPEDGQWLDIIIQDMDGTANTIYYCNTSFDMVCQEEEEGATWNTYKQYFTSGETLDFVATNVLLANNAKIDFLSSNGIYMYNSAGTGIVAGMEGGSKVNFWAGANTPQNAPFSVDYNGNLIAQNASISGSVYATDGVFSGSVYATNGVFSGTVYADAGRFAGNVWVPFTKVEELDRDGNYFVLSGKTHIIKDDWSSTARALLPTPSSALNGFCYDILLVPPLTQMSGELRLKTYGNYQIYDFCSTSLAANSYYSVTLYRGNFKFVCLNYGGTWTWALVDATANSSYGFSTSSNI